SATQLLQQFGSIEGLIEKAADVPSKWQKKLEGQADTMRRYRDVATIRTNVPLDIRWEECRWPGYDADLLLELCDRLEFPSLKARLGLGRAAAMPLAVPQMARPELVPRPVTWGELKDLLPRDRYTPMANDADQWTFAVGPEALQVTGPPSDLLAAIRHARIALPHLKPLLHRIELLQGHTEIFDFALASYLLHAGLTTHTLEAALKRMGLESLLPVNTPVEAVSAMQAALPQFEKAVSDAGLQDVLQKLELPLAWPLAAMEKAGIAVDKPYLEQLGRTLDARLRELSSEIHGIAGTEFNLNSPKQVGEVLFDRLKLPGAKKTKTGYATGVEILADMAPYYPIVALLLQHREVAKLKSTYVDTLPTQLREGRVHTTFNQTVAATGRLSSSEPNLQNIPVRSELGRDVRKAFIAPSGHVLLSADYSQIELRILAHVSQDPALTEAFRTGQDVHTATAAQVFGLRPQDVTSDIRRRAKEVNFGIMYGMSGHGLSQRLGIPRKEAQAFIDAYLDRFSGVRDYLRSSVEQAEARGWVATLQGRRRVIPDINSRNGTVKRAAERMAVNAPIQGTAADFIKEAMLRVYHALVEGRLPGRLLLQVHDELLLEVPEGQVERAASVIRPLMEGVFPLSVPLQVDVSWGPNWAELHKMAHVGSAGS
ncbi:MAG TPA: DNA polymerase, partial [Candidatus Xenobia bacterium]